MKKRINITLKSDLCVASGYSFAGIIDSDVCFDSYGIPYIPARRLKGCFRDVAENLLYSVIPAAIVDELFGKPGSAQSGILRIYNAHPVGCSRLRSEIDSFKQNSKINNLFTSQRILEQYSRVVTQTEIDEYGAVKDMSLRTTRVINHFSPSGSEMVFEALAEYSSGYDQVVEKIVRATKNIGLKRNRGFGAVVCRLGDIENKNVSSLDDSKYESDGEYVISYCIENDEPLMLSQMSDTHSENYISGQMILGYLAGVYLKAASNNNADSDEFRDLFLNGNTKYINAYLCDAEGKKTFYPAPLSLNRTKKNKILVDTFFDLPESERFPGNQPKMLRGKFVYFDDGNSENTVRETEVKEVEVKEVDKKIYYHHRKERDNQEGILYSSEAIEPNQSFRGEIYTKGKYVNLIISLLRSSDIYFGKSKAAQYGHCVIKKVEPAKASNIRKYNVADTNSEIRVTLLTDAVFRNNDSDYTVLEKNVYEQISRQLGLIPDDRQIRTIMATGLNSGYNAKWNLHKSICPVVKAGSCFVFKAGNKPVKEFDFVGVKNQEGYGYVRVEPLKNVQINEVTHNNPGPENPINVVNPESRAIICEIFKKALLGEIIEKKPISLGKASKSQIGRVILMLKQSVDFCDFRNRIESIKTESVRKEFLSKLITPLEENNQLCIRGLCGNTENDSSFLYYDHLTKSLKMADEEINVIWKDYLMHQLTIIKYEAKEV